MAADRVAHERGNVEAIMALIEVLPRTEQAEIVQRIVSRLAVQPTDNQWADDPEPTRRGALLDWMQSRRDPEPVQRGAMLERIRTRPKTGLPPPTDEEQEQWRAEYLSEKYGL